MKSSTEIMGDAQNNFVKSRRGESKKYTRWILNFLVERREQDPEGWVRAHELKNQKICNEQNLFRLLKDLVDGNIIQRKEKNFNKVYYRIPPAAKNVEFYTYEELYEIDKIEINKLKDEIFDLRLNFSDAESVLYRHPKIWDEYLKEKAETQKIRTKSMKNRKREN